MTGGDDNRDKQPGPLWRRLLWFAGLWAGGVLVVAALGYGIRLVFIP